MDETLGPGSPSQCALRLVPWNEVDRSHPVDYHMHTNLTDGTASITEMIAAANRAELKEILISEHVRHTSTYWEDFARQVRDESLDGVKVYVGCEAKILDLNGTLDAPAAIAPLCDAVIGSVHSAPEENGTGGSWSKMDAVTARRIELDLALAIVRQSKAHIIGHPMGMTITKFRINPREELFKIAEACRESGKAFELNPRYCIERDVHIEAAKAAGCKVSFGSDAHFIEAVGTSWTRFLASAE
jgi:histidinol phosphatase-like PHP family hydrolase